jgi:ribosomal protein S17E
MVCGDVNYSDNPRDIAGYATLLMEYLEKKEKESEDQKKNQ